MPKLLHRVTTVVRRVERLTTDVSAFELADPDDWELPPFTAGSHIDVHLPSGAVRQYSLFGDPGETKRYRIAVQRNEAGRGGSVELHHTLEKGTVVPVSLPRNHFPLVPAAHHLLIAGGIGITPLLAMAQALDAAGQSFELHYLSRTPRGSAFHDVLEPWVARGVAHHHFSRTGAGRFDVAGALDALAPDAHVYCCGPAGLIAAVVAEAARRSIDRVSVEAFTSTVARGDAAFTVELARSGRTVPVASGQTILEALRGASVEIPASCEAGVCLECRTRVLAGTPVHRDIVMSAADRREFMTPCVSGCAGDRLVLDL